MINMIKFIGTCLYEESTLVICLIYPIFMISILAGIENKKSQGLYCSIAFLISIIITLPIPIYMALGLKQIKTDFSNIYNIVINLILTQYIYIKILLFINSKFKKADMNKMLKELSIIAICLILSLNLPFILSTVGICIINKFGEYPNFW